MSTFCSPLIDITPATAADSAQIASCLVYAMQIDLMDRFLLHEQDITKSLAQKLEWARSTVPKAFDDPANRLWKATLKEDPGQLVGFAGITYKDGESEGKENENTKRNAVDEPPPVVNGEFAGRLFGGLKEKWRQHVGAEDHVVWTNLHVLPTHQRLGIGTALMAWGFEHYDLHDQKIWIQTQMRGRNLYRKLGWVDVDYFDIDLSEYGGKYRGLGVHRSPCLLRMPSPLVRVEGIMEE